MLSSDLLIDTGSKIKAINGVSKDLAAKVQDVVSRLLHGEQIPSGGSSAQPQKATIGEKFKMGCFSFIFIGCFIPMAMGNCAKDEDSTKSITTLEQSKNIDKFVPVVEKKIPWTPAQMLQRYNKLAPTMGLPLATIKAYGEYTLTRFA